MQRYELEQMQSLPLEAKVIKSQQRIREWYEHWEGDVYVSVSGKDSGALLHLVRSLYPDVPGVFCNTGLEFPEIVEVVKSLENVIIIRPKMPFTEVIEHYGYPIVSKEQAQYIQEYRTTKSDKLKDIRWNGKKNPMTGKVNSKISEKWKYLTEAPFDISHKCCQVMKKKPFIDYEKETGRKPFLGITSGESSMRLQGYAKYGCNAFNIARPVSRPLSFWTAEDIWEYLHQHDIPYASVYDKGYDRTGCMFCMFGVHMEKEPNRFQRMKITHPKLYEYCMTKLGLKEVLDYIKVPYE